MTALEGMGKATNITAPLTAAVARIHPVVLVPNFKAEIDRIRIRKSPGQEVRLVQSSTDYPIPFPAPRVLHQT